MKNKNCLGCGRPVEGNQQFDTDYCAAKYAEDHGIPYIEDPMWERES